MGCVEAKIGPVNSMAIEGYRARQFEMQSRSRRTVGSYSGNVKYLSLGLRVPLHLLHLLEKKDQQKHQTRV